VNSNDAAEGALRDGELAGKVALITGGASGIGAASARVMAREGAAVAVADFDAKRAEDVAKQLRASGARAISIAVDVARPEQVAAMVQRTRSEFGRLDALVNSAGISPPMIPTHEYPLAEWDRCLAINLSGTFYAIRHAVPAMLASGGGAIVNISSMMGQIAHSGIPAYTATKHGVVGLTKVVALDYAKQGIRCNAVGPGNTDTPMTRGSMPPGVFEALGKVAPVGRFGTPEEIGELVSFLASPRASFITGAYVVIDGGFAIQ
jgi:NAD(P)-dependent dehydrogenase (short-subunit alcohol dehydrogenase family)